MSIRHRSLICYNTKRMTDFRDMFNVTVRATLDNIPFEFRATRDGSRIIVSGLMCLIHNTYWKIIQDTCMDIQPAGNNMSSIPTKWFLQITANPPAFVRHRTRRILRMVHLICRDAISDGTNFRSDRVFTRKTSTLQQDCNILESLDDWVPALELITKGASGSDDDADDSRPDDEIMSSHGPKIDLSSAMIVTNTMTFSEAVELVRVRLPPTMQNDAFTHAATHRAISLQLTASDFYKWLDEMDANIMKANIAQANAITAQANANISRMAWRRYMCDASIIDSRPSDQLV